MDELVSVLSRWNVWVNLSLSLPVCGIVHNGFMWRQLTAEEKNSHSNKKTHHHWKLRTNEWNKWHFLQPSIIHLNASFTFRINVISFNLKWQQQQNSDLHIGRLTILPKWCRDIILTTLHFSWAHTQCQAEI